MARYCEGDQMKQDKMHGAYGMDGRKEEYVEGFGWEV